MSEKAVLIYKHDTGEKRASDEKDYVYDCITCQVDSQDTQQLLTVLDVDYLQETKVQMLVELGNLEHLGEVIDPYPVIGEHGYDWYQKNDPVSQLDYPAYSEIKDYFTWPISGELGGSYPERKDQYRRYKSLHEACAFAESQDAMEMGTYIFVPQDNQQQTGAWMHPRFEASNIGNFSDEALANILHKANRREY